MISITLLEDNSHLVGFTVKGHSGFAEQGFDIVCASVSTATILTSNTITEIFKDEATVQTGDGYIHFLLNQRNNNGENLLLGLELFLEELQKQYPLFIKTIRRKNI